MDVTTETFETEVIEASKTRPVVVDFWAPWCGPCRALTPVIESVAASFDGRIKLAKINSDENQDLAAALGIRSIPSVIAFRHGEPAARFVGAQPEGQVRDFFESLLPSASEQALERAEAALAAGRLDDAERELAAVEADITIEARLRTLKDAAARARRAAEGPDEAELRARLTENPDDHDARLALANLYALERHYREAMDAFLEILRRDRRWRDGEARRQLLALFDMIDDPPLVNEYRRKLAGMLY